MSQRLSWEMGLTRAGLFADVKVELSRHISHVNHIPLILLQAGHHTSSCGILGGRLEILGIEKNSHVFEFLEARLFYGFLE
jgi:hypothetical protein